jgi:NADPH:quinone reductase-like Zn-dependent oxidoreductase
MKAIHMYQQGGPVQFVYEDAPQPQPGHGEALVRVFASGVTPTEPTWAASWATHAGARRTQPIPGHDVSGIVEDVGPGILGVSIGEEVYGLTDFWRDGAQAEYTIALPGELAHKPRALDMLQAASVPLPALTAWQAFFDHAHLSTGQTILIHGAGGSVGVFAVQMAHWAGARVIGTAAARQHNLLRSLGADELFDYTTTTRFEDEVHNVDVVLDAVGGETLERSWGVLKPGGVLVSVVQPPSRERAAEQNVRAVFFIVQPNHAQLTRITGLIDTGQLRPVVENILPLDQAQNAYTGARHGKTVLQVFDEDKLLRDVAGREYEALESYDELGMTGDMSRERAYEEEFASGEVSRELREMRHGEFGPKAYEWLEKEHEQPKEP